MSSETPQKVNTKGTDGTDKPYMILTIGATFFFIMSVVGICLFYMAGMQSISTSGSLLDKDGNLCFLFNTDAMYNYVLVSLGATFGLAIMCIIMLIPQKKLLLFIIYIIVAGTFMGMAVTFFTNQEFKTTRVDETLGTWYCFTDRNMRMYLQILLILWIVLLFFSFGVIMLYQACNIQNVNTVPRDDKKAILMDFFWYLVSTYTASGADVNITSFCLPK
jgi:hypothetical protein